MADEPRCTLQLFLVNSVRLDLVGAVVQLNHVNYDLLHVVREAVI